MELQRLWDDMMTCLKGELGADVVEIFFGGVQPTAIHNHTLHIRVGERVYANWIEDNYQDAVNHAASTVFGHDLQVKVNHQDDPTSEAPLPPLPSGHDLPQVNGTGSARPQPPAFLDAAKTFESFVVGECNRLARAAAKHVASVPIGVANYNPLFIYGATGLGKTHLLHAVAHEVWQRDPSTRIVYVTTEQFTNELVEGIQHGRMESFRERYRRANDLLLLDDVQFLSRRESTQQELFNTLNALQAAHRQVILTSDVEPQHIEGLEPRLRTRFVGGLVVDMDAPDGETLHAILRSKAEGLGLAIPPDLADAIANAVQGSIRELEGYLNALHAACNTYREPPSVAFARQHLPRLFVQERPKVSVPQIIEAVATTHNLKVADITGTGRTRALTRPRHIAMFLARKHTTLSFPELGREFGNRDHSTIQHGCRKIESQLKKDADLAQQIEIVESMLRMPRSR